MVFHMFQAKQLGGFAFALVLNAELIRFSRNNKGAKIFVEFSSYSVTGMCFFLYLFILGLGICGKHRKGHVFRQFTLGYSQCKLQCRILWPRFGLFRVGFGLG